MVASVHAPAQVPLSERRADAFDKTRDGIKAGPRLPSSREQKAAATLGVLNILALALVLHAHCDPPVAILLGLQSDFFLVV